MRPSATKKTAKPIMPKIPDRLLAQLRNDLVARRVASGIGCLENHRDLIAALEPTQKNAAAFLGQLTQWVDMGYGEPRVLKELLSRFPRSRRASLPVSDYLHLKMAEGLVATSEESFENAIRCFEAVLGFENEIEDKEIVAI